MQSLNLLNRVSNKQVKHLKAFRGRGVALAALTCTLILSAGCGFFDFGSGEQNLCTPYKIDWNKKSPLGFRPKSLAALAKVEGEFEDYRVANLDLLQLPARSADDRVRVGVINVRVRPKFDSATFWTGRTCQYRRVELQAEVTLRGVYGNFDHQFEAAVRSQDNERIYVVGTLPAVETDKETGHGRRKTPGGNAGEDIESGEDSGRGEDGESVGSTGRVEDAGSEEDGGSMQESGSVKDDESVEDDGSVKDGDDGGTGEKTESGEDNDDGVDIDPCPGFEPPDHIEFSATILSDQGLVKGRVAAMYSNYIHKGCGGASNGKEVFKARNMLSFPSGEDTQEDRAR